MFVVAMSGAAFRPRRSPWRVRDQQSIESAYQGRHVDRFHDVCIEARCFRLFSIRRLPVAGDRHQDWPPATGGNQVSAKLISIHHRQAQIYQGGIWRKVGGDIERARTIEGHTCVIPDHLERLGEQPRRVDVVVDDKNLVSC